MKRVAITLSLGVLCLALANAQSAIDAYNISQGDLRGTARFMSMAGAFGALGGDLSTLTQNPAGIGVYRSSEIGATIDFDFQSTSTPGGFNDSQTKVYCNNFGYVGTLNLDGDLLKSFNWGATFSRKASFDRNFKGSFSSMPTSLTNYMAFTATNQGVLPEYLQVTNTYNPYYDMPLSAGDPDWLNILGYNSLMINPINYNQANYLGLFRDGTHAVGTFDVQERGYIDEYSINFGGNFSNIVYWGIGFGITDLRFTQRSGYGENLIGALIPDEQVLPTQYGYANIGLNNWKEITGSGFNVKLGVIVKPVEEFRLGIAVHTPNWYTLNQSGQGWTTYIMGEMSQGMMYDPSYSGEAQTEYDYFDYRMRSPWRLILSAAGVVGGRFIISADYERDAYDSMSFSDSYWTDFSYENQDIKDYFQASNTIRIGAEYRVTPQLSVRAGYSYTGDNVQKGALNQDYVIYTGGPYLTETNPAYTFNKTTQYITFGLGYRFSQFYIDAAFAYRSRDSQYQPFTRWQGVNYLIPTAKVNQSDSNLVLTVGYKF